MRRHETPVDARPFFTVRTLADHLGLNERSVRRLIATRKIVSYRIEGSRRIKPSDVDAYLETKREAA